MARKRNLEHEFDSIDEVKAAGSSTIHGAVASVSPIKKGRNSIFFDGFIADQTSKIRMVGFDCQQQKKISHFHSKNTPVTIVNCEVKPSRQGHGFEIMLKNGTEIRESSKKLDVPAIIQECMPKPKSIHLNSLPDIEQFEKVIVHAKAIAVSGANQVSDKIKQDVIIADSTGSAKVTFWEDNVDTLTEGVSYRLENFVVREYQTMKYLAMSKAQGSKATTIPDLNVIGADDPVAEMDNSSTIQGVQVIGVSILDRYKACMQCKARVEPSTPPFGKCTKVECLMLQRFDLCSNQITARLLLMYTTDDNQMKTVHCSAYGDLVHRIANVASSDLVTPEALISSPMITSLTYVNDKKIIKTIQRP